jgi:hypothetical protein
MAASVFRRGCWGKSIIVLYKSAITGLARCHWKAMIMSEFNLDHISILVDVQKAEPCAVTG